jgi:putative membrane protein
MPYEKIEKEDLILRDELAIERTKLAEERTYLAYIRTGMSLALGGAFFIGYFREGLFSYVGYIAMIIAMIFLGYGFYNHRKSMALIEKISMGVIKFKNKEE